MKTLLKKEGKNTNIEDIKIELLELRRNLKTLADTILEDAAEIDAFFEDQLRGKKNALAIVPKSDWHVVKRYLEQWKELDMVTGL